MSARNNPIWIMSSAFPGRPLAVVIEKAREVGAQGIEVCVFRHGGTRNDHIATHMDYERFGLDEARRAIGEFNAAGLKFSIGAYENLIGGDEAARVENQNHILRLIRMAHLLGGNANNVNVGTFVGYNDELGRQDGGFQKNLEAYEKVFRPLIKYAADLGVTVMYENCPMEGWRPATASTTYNNLPGTLAARKLMYTLIDSPAHGETYDPSHDAWQGTDPVEVLRRTDMSRVRRVHIKGTRNLRSEARIFWGGLYPMQAVDPDLASRAGIPTCAHEWDRHHYQVKLPGFGGSDSIDWTSFLEALDEVGYGGPLVIENEAVDSKQTEDLGAIVQGFQATVLCLAPKVWKLEPNQGYRYDASGDKPLDESILPTKDVPLVTMDKLS